MYYNAFLSQPFEHIKYRNIIVDREFALRTLVAWETRVGFASRVVGTPITESQELTVVRETELFQIFFLPRRYTTHSECVFYSPLSGFSLLAYEVT